MRMKKARLSIRARHIAEGYSFVSLWIAGFFLFMAVPLGRSMYYSFQDLKMNTGKMTAEFVGWKNYRYAFTVDIDFMPILLGTIKTVVIQVPLILIFAMFCALLLHVPMRGRLFFRGVYFLPVIVASGNSLKRLMEQGAAMLPIFKQYDLYTVMLDYIPEQLLTPLLAMMDSLMIVMWGSGVQIIIFMAGLQSIPTPLYEAAKCDGATPWEVFWKITFPMMMPMTLVCTLFSIVDSFTKVDNQMIKYNWTLMFAKLNFGYASAVGWIYFVFVFLVILIVMLLFRNTTALAQDRR